MLNTNNTKSFDASKQSVPVADGCPQEGVAITLPDGEVIVLYSVPYDGWGYEMGKNDCCQFVPIVKQMTDILIEHIAPAGWDSKAERLHYPTNLIVQLNRHPYQSSSCAVCPIPDLI